MSEQVKDQTLCRDKPAGPFSVIPMVRNKRPMLVFGPTQEHRPVSVMIPDQLAEWLNELWVKKADDQELAV